MYKIYWVNSHKNCVGASVKSVRPVRFFQNKQPLHFPLVWTNIEGYQVVDKSQKTYYFYYKYPTTLHRQEELLYGMVTWSPEAVWL